MKNLLCLIGIHNYILDENSPVIKYIQYFPTPTGRNHICSRCKKEEIFITNF